MKNLDEKRLERVKRDRSFTIGGQEFERKVGVRPEDILRWNEATGGEVVPTEAEWIEIYDETVLALLAPGQEDKWREVRAIDDNPLTVHDLLELIAYLLSEATGRPTGPSSDSSDGRDSTGTTSTDGSGSPALAAVPAR